LTIWVKSGKLWVIMETVEYYTVSEIAAKLRVDTETVYRWLNKGTLKGIRVGNTWRIPVSEYNRFTQRVN
jgi:excisionase family DNA binding protein